MTRSLAIRGWMFTSALVLGLPVPSLTAAAPPNIYVQQNLVANVAGQAAFTDPNLLDPWGIALSTSSPFWVSNHLSGTSTLYSGNGAITAVVVTIPPSKGSKVSFGRPTGQVQNASTGFLLVNGVKASFIWATEDGAIQAWNSGTVAQVMVDNSAAGASYKGLAINPSATAPLIYAANFFSGKIDVFNSSFSPVTETEIGRAHV